MGGLFLVMQYAILNGKKIEATKSGEIGICRCCNSKVRAHCGNIIVWHWKHINKEECDSWWEPETKWHRDWKNKFNKENQEVICFDETTGEKHIADVKFNNNIVIEFQNSSIGLDEIESRNNFHKKIIWVLNGDKFRKRFLVKPLYKNRFCINALYYHLKTNSMGISLQESLANFENKSIHYTEQYRDSDLYIKITNYFKSKYIKWFDYSVYVSKYQSGENRFNGIFYTILKSKIIELGLERFLSVCIYKWKHPNVFSKLNLFENHIYIDLGDLYLYRIYNNIFSTHLLIFNGYLDCVRIKKRDFINNNISENVQNKHI